MPALNANIRGFETAKKTMEKSHLSRLIGTPIKAPV
jgi:hypothetical protein